MFFMKILLILPKFHKKTLSGPGDIKIFCPGRRMYIFALLPLMDAVFSEERQLMKWVGIFHNHFHNILRLSNVLPNFALTTVKGCAIIIYKHSIYDLSHKLPNDLRLRILGNWEISGKCLNPIE